MKRLILFLCTAVLLFGMTGCGSSDTVPTSSTEGMSSSVSSEASSMPLCEDVGAWDTGFWEENIYRNPWADIAFVLPDGWNALTTEQILTLLGAGADIISGELNTDKESLSASISETDLYAFYTMKATGDAFFFLDIYDREAGGVPDMTPEEYLSQLTAIYENLTGYTVTAGETEYDTFCGKNSVGKALMLENTENTEAPPSVQTYMVVEHGSYLLVYCGSVRSGDKAVFDELSSLLESCTTVEAFSSAPPETPVKTAEGEWDAGHWDGNRYTNEWAELSFTLPEGWKRDLSAENAIDDSALHIFTLSDESGSSITLRIIDKTQSKRNMNAEEYLDIAMAENFRTYDTFTAELSPVETASYGGKETASCSLGITTQQQQLKLTWCVQTLEPYFLVTTAVVVSPEQNPTAADTIIADIVGKP